MDAQSWLEFLKEFIKIPIVIGGLALISYMSYWAWKDGLFKKDDDGPFMD